MKKHTKIAVMGVAALLAVTTIVWNCPRKITYISTAYAATTTPATLSYAQKAWLGSLEWCESRGQPDAVNPEDSDGTPSYGILQFKPSTFDEFAKRYGIATTTGYMDPEVQEEIVTQMILRGDVNWSRQFPACTKKLGYPPTA